MFRKEYKVSHDGCQYVRITIIPKMLWIKYFYKTTRDVVVYFVFPGGGIIASNNDTEKRH